MAHELRAGDFVPLDFELNFADPEQIAPITLSDGAVTLNMSGVADRVDGWLHDGKLYLRVVDYKTGRKGVLALGRVVRHGAADAAVPVRARALRVPSATVTRSCRQACSTSRRATCSSRPTAGSRRRKAAKKRAGAVRRSGLLLDDEAVLHAMEHSDTPQYLPASSRRKTDALASAEQLGLLARHIETTLLDLAHELRDGSITADPYFRSGQDTACTHCDYLTVCHFTPGAEGRLPPCAHKAPRPTRSGAT